MNSPQFATPERQLHERRRRRHRIRWAGRHISEVDAFAAFADFAGDDELLEETLGRVLVLLDRHGLLGEAQR